MANDGMNVFVNLTSLQQAVAEAIRNGVRSSNADKVIADLMKAGIGSATTQKILSSSARYANVRSGLVGAQRETSKYIRSLKNVSVANLKLADQIDLSAATFSKAIPVIKKKDKSYWSGLSSEANPLPTGAMDARDLMRHITDLNRRAYEAIAESSRADTLAKRTSRLPSSEVYRREDRRTKQRADIDKLTNAAVDAMYNDPANAGRAFGMLMRRAVDLESSASRYKTYAREMQSKAEESSGIRKEQLQAEATFGAPLKKLASEINQIYRSINIAKGGSKGEFLAQKRTVDEMVAGFLRDPKLSSNVKMYTDRLTQMRDAAAAEEQKTRADRALARIEQRLYKQAERAYIASQSGLMRASGIDRAERSAWAHGFAINQTNAPMPIDVMERMTQSNIATTNAMNQTNATLVEQKKQVRELGNEYRRLTTQVNRAENATGEAKFKRQEAMERRLADIAQMSPSDAIKALSADNAALRLQAETGFAKSAETARRRKIIDDYIKRTMDFGRMSFDARGIKGFDRKRRLLDLSDALAAKAETWMTMSSRAAFDQMMSDKKDLLSNKIANLTAQNVKRQASAAAAKTGKAAVASTLVADPAKMSQSLDSVLQSYVGGIKNLDMMQKAQLRASLKNAITHGGRASITPEMIASTKDYTYGMRAHQSAQTARMRAIMTRRDAQYMAETKQMSGNDSRAMDMARNRVASRNRAIWGKFYSLTSSKDIKNFVDQYDKRAEREAKESMDRMAERQKKRNSWKRWLSPFWTNQQGARKLLPLSVDTQDVHGKPIRTAFPTVRKITNNVQRFTSGMAMFGAKMYVIGEMLKGIFDPILRFAETSIRRADEYTRQKNMWDIALGSHMTASSGTFAQWYRRSFDKASELRMSADMYRRMMMQAAPIFETAVWKKDAPARFKATVGEHLVKSFEDVELIMGNLLRMKAISGSTDYEFEHALTQIVQMISKGKGNMTDIRPLLESGGHMGEMIARYGFRVHAGDLSALSASGDLRGDVMLANLMSRDTTENLEILQRKTARTWEDVSNIVGNKFERWLTPLTRSLSDESGGGIASNLIAIAEQIFNDKSSRALALTVKELLHQIKEWMPKLGINIPRIVGHAIQTMGGLVIAGSILTQAVLWLGSLIGALFPYKSEFFKGIEAISETMAESFVETRAIGDGLIAIGRSISKSPLMEWDTLGTANELLTDHMDKVHKDRQNLIENRVAPSLEGLLANGNANTEDIKKHTRTATATQLAILKQVAGARVVNRVTHVAPNITSNVGTIKNGVQYEQLLKDLGLTFEHVVTQYLGMPA